MKYGGKSKLISEKEIALYVKSRLAASKKITGQDFYQLTASISAADIDNKKDNQSLLKNYVVAAGAMLAAILMAGPEASAATHRAPRAYRGGFVHAAPMGRARVFAGARFHGRGVHSRGYARRMIGGRTHLAGRRHGHLRGALIAGRHHSRHVAALRRDDMIRNDVGPAADYTPASTGGQVGGASYYSGGRTASGGLVGSATCAHRSLPFGTKVLVTNLSNARSAILTVNDRGPFVGGRIVDVSRSAAGTLGMLGSGVARVSLKVLGRG